MQRGLLNSQSVSRISRDLTKTLAEFEYEVKLIYCEIIKPRWNQPPWRNRLPNVLHASMMWCFARVDLLSAFWKGGRKSQSVRMVDFMHAYMGRPRNAASMALQMWRHNMMHTGQPRDLFDTKSLSGLTWLLHWGEEQMGRSGHFMLSGPKAMQISMTLFHLVEDLKKAQRKYLRDLRGNQALMRNLACCGDRNLDTVSPAVHEAA